MTACALWSGLYGGTAGYITFSADRLTANATSYPCSTFSAVCVTSGKYAWAVQNGIGGLADIGIADSLSATTANDPSNAIVYRVTSGAIYSFTAGSYSQVGTGPTVSTGSWLMPHYDATNKLLWFTQDGTNFYGTGSSAYTASQVAAGTGGISTSQITEACPFVFFDFLGYVVLNSGASSYPFSPVSGFGNLPVTLSTSLTPVTILGDDITAGWATDSLASGLNYSINGGSWEACGGTVSGASGTATAGTIASIGFETVAFQDAANPLDQTAPQYTAGVPGPTSLTATLAAAFGNGAYIASEGNPSQILAQAPQKTIYISGIYGDASGITGAGGIQIFNSDGVEVSHVILSGGGTVTALDAGNLLYGATPTSGGAASVSGPLISFTGTLDASLGGPDSPQGTATISANGTVTQFGSAGSPDTWQGTQSLPFYSIELDPGALDGSMGLAIGIWAEPAEVLTILSAGVNDAGTLVLNGTVTNATLTELNISTNGGEGFAAASSLSVTGTAWSATGDMLSAGTHPVQVEDATTDTLSNTVDVVISGEQITLTSLGGTIGGNLTFTGESTNGTSAALDISVNGTWTEATGYTPATSFSGAGPEITVGGTYSVLLRDHTNQYIQSNTESIVIGLTETISLTKAGGNVGQTLKLGGNTTNGPAASLEYTWDDGATWNAVSNYSATPGTEAAPWTGTGGVLAPNTYRIAVRDANIAPPPVSNYVTLTLVQESIQLLTASLQAAPTTGTQVNMVNRLRALLPSQWFPSGAATAAGANTLVLGGTSYNGPPGGMQASLNGGATWVATSGYGTAAGTVAAPWTAYGPQLAAGSYTILVRDSGNYAVISNPLPLVVTAPAASSVATILNMVLSGPGAALAGVYGFLAWVAAQMRLATSTGGMIDLWAYDFFGPALLRNIGQKDAGFIARIMNSLLAPLVTRQAMIDALFRQTGRLPVIFEPFNTGDTGGLNTGSMGYGVAGAYGCLAIPAQAFITAFRPNGTSNAGGGGGYGSPIGGYGMGALQYLNGGGTETAIEDAAIYATINATKAAGVVCWVNIQD